MLAKRYPAATWKGDGRRYGTLTAKHPRCFVAHTTETAGLPGYDDGNSAPHCSYLPQTRQWIQHAENDAWVGTLRRGNGPISWNAKAQQVEIVCYSDRTVADRYNRLWVGDLTAANYLDLATYIAWLYTEEWIGSLNVWMPHTTWRYGYDSPYRMDIDRTLNFDGVTAHGGIEGQTHWNTGVLDLWLLGRLASEIVGTVPEYARPSWDLMVEAGIYTSHTQPSQPVLTEQQAVFWHRARIVGPWGPIGPDGEPLGRLNPALIATTGTVDVEARRLATEAGLLASQADAAAKATAAAHQTHRHRTPPTNTDPPL